MEHLQIIRRLESRLALELPGNVAHERMLARVQPLPAEVPVNARPSAVLTLLFPHENDLHVLLIKRTEDGRAHSGQISFPGGRQEPGDADLRATALREANEEVGVMSSEVEIIGGLTPLYIPVSNFQVYPYVGFAATRPEYRLSVEEVAHVIEVPVVQLLSGDIKAIATVTSPANPGFIKEVNVYKLSNDTVIWGATAMILSELEVLLSEIL